jgi:hypothetical protein
LEQWFAMHEPPRQARDAVWRPPTNFRAALIRLLTAGSKTMRPCHAAARSCSFNSLVLILDKTGKQIEQLRRD